ncbi:hypothetical protein GOBAR_DD26756 [Gossypium barbadense]|nr:hypothetical protein GOBAR_DD26756 [Gossypium barbadense]
MLACKLKLGDLKGALLDTDFASRDGEYNAYIELNDIDAAVESFKNALDLEPNDGLWNKERACGRKEEIADRRDQEKRDYSRMFQYITADFYLKDQFCFLFAYIIKYLVFQVCS